jgi:hypothetical protein
MTKRQFLILLALITVFNFQGEIVGGMPSNLAYAQSQTVFSGIPSVKISEGGTERTPEILPREIAINLVCTISQIGGRYYWATRENTEMVRQVSGAFVTYVAINGSGYVRVIDKNGKAPTSLMSSTEMKFDYVEHLLIGLRSMTYYGNLK